METGSVQSSAVFCGFKTGLNWLWFRPVPNQSQTGLQGSEGGLWYEKIIYLSFYMYTRPPFIQHLSYIHSYPLRVTTSTLCC